MLDFNQQFWAYTMKNSVTHFFQGIKFVIEVNFYISVLLLIVGGCLSITTNYVLFEFNEDLYGIFAQNLKTMLLYLGVAEFLLCVHCWVRKNKQIFLFVGLFFLLLIGSLTTYSEVNNIEIDPNISWFFLYIGISHILFGLYAYLLDVK
jgi:hypothetical protein